MKVLDRYILRELIGPLFFGLAAFTGMFAGVELVQAVRTAVDYGAPIGSALHLIALRLPQIVVWTVPMAMLLAALLAMGRLSGTGEIIAMKAAAVSFYRIAAPVAAMGLGLSMLTVAVGEWVVPAANLEYRRVLVEDVQGGQLPTVTRNVILKEYQGGFLRGILYASEYDVAERAMRDVTVVELDGRRPVRTTYARRVVWEKNTWWMEDGVIHIHGGEPGVTVDFRQGRQPVTIGYRPEQVVAAQKNPEEMTIRELREQIAFLESRGADTRTYALNLHLKLSIPAASFLFAFLAAPLGVRPHRSAASVGFGLSMVIIIVYYVLMTLGTAMAQSGTVPPAMGAWLPDGVLAAAGAGLWASAGRR
ncbi:MAG: LptF/LptG family permease [Firmicutes bacterium]|nr:LptF/LptG family permease [Bacillota bacterium]